MSKPPPPSLPSPPPPPPPPPPNPRLKRNPRLPDPPTRLTRSRTSKSDVLKRGFHQKRGTSKSPHLKRVIPDASDDEDAVSPGPIASDDSENGFSMNHPPDDTLMAADGGGNMDVMINTTADPNCSVGNPQGDDGKLGSPMGDGDNSIKLNDDGSVARDDIGNDFAILGDVAEYESFNLDNIDIADEASPSDNSSVDGSVQCLNNVKANVSPSKDSAASFEMLQTVYRRPTRPPDLYVMNLVVAIELSYIAHRHEVTGDGNCGYYAIMNVLIRHFRRVCPDHPSLLHELSGVTFAKANWFRLMIYEYVYRECNTLLDPSDSIFVDGDGVRMSDFRIASRLTAGHRRRTTYDGKVVPSFFEKVDKIYNDKYFNEEVVGEQTLLTRFWMDQAFVLPLLAKMYQTSIICYNAYGSIGFEVEGGSRSFRNGRTTNVYFYRPDGKVQCQVLSGYRKPWEDAVCVYYDGTSHFNFVTLIDDMNSFSSVPSINLPASNVSPPPSMSLPSDSANNDDTPLNSLISPAKPPTNLYTPCDSNRSPPKLVHMNPITTPMKQEILQYKSPDPYVIQGGCSDPQLVMYRSEGNYNISMNREDFNTVLVVNHVLVPGKGEDKVLQLKWRTHSKRGVVSDLLKRYLLTDPVFSDHLHPLFPNGLEVLARHKVAKSKVSKSKVVKHKVAKKPKQNKPRKGGTSRSKHGFAAYASGVCSHHESVRRSEGDIANKCPVKFFVGFKEDEVLDFIRDDSKGTIPLRVIVKGNCTHLKHHNPNQLRGSVRAEYIQSAGFTPQGTFKDPSPQFMFEQQHKMSEDPSTTTATDNKALVKNRDLANNLKREMVEATMVSMGLVPGDRTKNFWRAYRNIVKIDLNRRRNYELQMNPDNPRPIKTDYAGVVQTYELLTEFSTRESTPLMIALWTAVDVKLTHYLGATGRLVLHIDGSHDTMPMDICVADGDTQQVWPLLISPSFILRERSVAMRRQLSPVTVMEMHSACTSSAAQIPQLKKFFEAQLVLCGSINRPLIFQSDCDKGIPNTLLVVLAFPGVEVVTRIQYMNLMLCFLAQYEVDGWNKSITSSHFSCVRSLLPCFFANCRPHVLRAVSRWVKASKRSSSLRNQLPAFKQLSYRLMSCGTGMLTISETIVAFGLTKYIVSREHVTGSRMTLLSKSSSYNDEELKNVGKTGTAFIKNQIHRIQQILSEKFLVVKQSCSTTDVERKSWLSKELVEMVKTAAEDIKLKISVSYCQNTVPGSHEICTAYFFGLLPNEPGKDVYPEWTHYSASRKPRFLKDVRHFIGTQTLVDHTSEMVEFTSPLYCMEFHNYLDEWVPSFASWNSSVLHVCQLEVIAPVDNSNGVSEANFKNRNENKEQRMSARDPGLSIHQVWDRSISQAKRLLRDVESVISFADTKRSKKKRGIDGRNQLELMVDEENGREQVWKKSDPNISKMNKVRENLRTLLEMENPRVSKIERYNRVKEYLMKTDALVDDKGEEIVTERTWHNWLSMESKAPKFLRNKKTREALEEFTRIMSVNGGENGSNGDFMLTNQTNLNTVSLLKLEYGGYREVIGVAQSLRLIEYELLMRPEERKLPRYFQDLIQNYVDRIISNPSFGNEVVTKEHTSIASMYVSDRQIEGDKIEIGSGPTIATDRLLVGINLNVAGDQLFFCSRYSMSIVASQSVIKDMVAALIPAEIKASQGDTEETLAKRYESCEWLDPIHVHGEGDTCVNGDSSYKCPMRRTVSMSNGPPSTIQDREADDYGRSTVVMLTYHCHESPLPRWTSRVLRNLDYALMLESWRDGWSYLTKPSRQSPPNWMQICVYNALMSAKMGPHRDNSTKKALSTMKMGKKPNLNTPYAGVPNSSVEGANVLIYTMGNAPMKMMWAFPDPHFPVDQERTKYVELEGFSISCGNGTLTIVDPMDDLLMQHRLEFGEGEVVVRGEGKTETDLRYRIAFVMRWLGNEEEFYTDTSTLRLTASMKKAMEKSKANNEFDGKGRDVYS